MDLTSRLRVQLEEATENAARVRFIHELKDIAADATQPAVCEVTGSVYGPICAYARTLPTAFDLHSDPVQSGAAGKQPSAVGIIPEPCYWTSELPFLYEARLQLRLGANELYDVTCAFGMRRLEIHGGHLRLERRRAVLRGAIVDAADYSHLEKVHATDSTLIMTPPSVAFLNHANAIGVKLLVDLRFSRIDLAELRRQYSWHPCVHGVLVDEDRLAEMAPSAPLVLAAIPADAKRLRPVPEAAQMIAFELCEHERPPSWIAALTKPVIAIRRGAPYANVEAAREAADSLQAALAPEFDLAGYFAGPVAPGAVAT